MLRCVRWLKLVGTWCACLLAYVALPKRQTMMAKCARLGNEQSWKTFLAPWLLLTRLKIDCGLCEDWFIICCPREGMSIGEWSGWGFKLCCGFEVYCSLTENEKIKCLRSQLYYCICNTMCNFSVAWFCTPLKISNFIFDEKWISKNLSSDKVIKIKIFFFSLWYKNINFWFKMKKNSLQEKIYIDQSKYFCFKLRWICGILHTYIYWRHNYIEIFKTKLATRLSILVTSRKPFWILQGLSLWLTDFALWLKANWWY